MDSPNSVAGSGREKTSPVVSKYLKERSLRCSEIYERKRPLTLLELPVDILQLIAKEASPADREPPQITHTNDLTALALTSTAMYNIAIPLIYSRFDIVWPDGQLEPTDSKSVDALTYGLSTLCLGSAFARTVRKSFDPNSRQPSKLADNDYAKYTKKFSLGNGPKDWVAEYMISKESGKMLGTLVASAITRMKNLETFVWDMPTGVLSRVFEALASLGDQPDNECKLSRVWVRWHDNSENFEKSVPSNPNNIPNGTALVPPGSQLTPVGIMLPPNASHPPPRPPVRYSEYHCEYPTFSVLPPLKSLTVLDIDEIGYLDEMAVLIERSKDTLRELRVSISPKAAGKAFAQTWDGPGLKQIDHRARWPGESAIGDRRLGGVLGVLVGKIYDIRKRKPKDKPVTAASLAEGSPSSATMASTTAQDQVNGAASSFSKNGADVQKADDAGTPLQNGVSTRGPSKESRTSQPNCCGRKRLEGKLKLHTLELERVALSLQVCRYAIDWSVLTDLTLLDCAQHDSLWKVLRKQFQPTPIDTTHDSSSRNKLSSPNTSMQYHLALKSIHADMAPASLIAFIKETLAPNSLEVLFLQDRKRASPPIPLETIFKGAIKRHSASLRKLLLDSTSKLAVESTRWRQWALTTDVVLYITSGRMSNLRELAVSLQYKDWHPFLQRLHNAPQLRSINIPQIADYPGPPEYPNGWFEPKELANQIVDIITLRPEIRLCYIGIGSKCFELLESRDTGNGGSSVNSSDPDGEAEDAFSDGEDEGDTPATDASDAGETQSDGELDAAVEAEAGAEGGEEQDEEEEEEGDGGDEDEDDDGFVDPGSGGIKLKLREILFYDDKVAIFRARHARL
ncbi:hypothetical protein C8A03DRAFT_13019 [Achaetomium macrosporum]|uniref:F-box domain-containing protein n=1 Tax=Achaetomium macrosporum TaxID=79813 RepID=A0AAN7CG59_9PEZI|nr:hypothetical protein C8A03DRAFT_13019 [Achaetomium macrosporum]